MRYQIVKPVADPARYLRVVAGMTVFFAAAVIFLFRYDPHAPSGQVVTLDHAQSVRFADSTGAVLALQEGVSLSQDWRIAAPPEVRASRGVVEGHYVIPFSLDRGDSESQALLIPRVARSAEVFINGIHIPGEMPADLEVNWDWYAPVMMIIPAGVLRQGDNQMDITVHALFQSTAGLSRIFIGAERSVTAMFNRLEFLQKQLPPITNTTTLIMSVPLSLIWLHGRRTTAAKPFTIYGLLAAAMAIFALRSLHVHAGEAPLPMALWLALVASSLAWAVGLFCIFILRFSGFNARFVEGGIVIFVAGATLALFLFPNSLFTEFRTLFVYVPMTVLGIGCMMLACVQALRQEDDPRLARDRVLLSLGLLLILPAAVHDLLWVRGLLHFEAVMWLPIVMPSVLLAISMIVANSYAHAWVAAHELNRDLTAKITEAQEEIRLSYEKRLEAERREGVAKERARLVEELHDGVGNRLSLLLTTLETSDLPREESARSISACLQDLRMIITAQDRDTLADALAELRWLHSGMLEVNGVTLTLECPPEARDIQLSPARLLNVLRITQEALSNAARHSGASDITIRVVRLPLNRLEIRVEDRGIAKRAPSAVRHISGRGLNTMRARTERLGGDLTLIPKDSGWTVVLNIPIDTG